MIILIGQATNEVQLYTRNSVIILALQPSCQLFASTETKISVLLGLQ